MTCRVFGPPIRSADEDEEGLAVCELCFTEATAEEIAASEMKVHVQEEQELLEALERQDGARKGDTIVAYCLL